MTYVLDAAMDEPNFGLNSDHAYWVSGLTLRDPSIGPGLGTIDAFSHAFGLADPQPYAQVATSGSSNGIPFTGDVVTWQDPQSIPATDELELKLTNIATATIDVRRARLNCKADVHVTSDGSATVHLGGCNRTISVG